MIPVSPATKNCSRNPQENNMGVANRILPPYIVAVQLKILIPVGMPTSIVAPAKKVFDIDDRPTVNMWCAQTPTPMKPIAISAPTMAGLPKIGLREKTGTTSDKMAKIGKIKT